MNDKGRMISWLALSGFNKARYRGKYIQSSKTEIAVLRKETGLFCLFVRVQCVILQHSHKAGCNAMLTAEYTAYRIPK